MTRVATGEREFVRESAAYQQFCREVSSALGDFARLALFTVEFDLLEAWALGTSSPTLDAPIEEMDHDQVQDWLSTIGLIQTLRLYDSSVGTEFAPEFNRRLDRMLEYAETHS